MGKRKRRSKSTTEPGPSSSKKPKKSKKAKTTERSKYWQMDLDKRFKIMKGAVEDVIEKKMTIRKAAEKWGVKRSTLADRVSGRVELGRRSGPPSILTRAEEQMLAEWIISMAQRGFGFNKCKLLKTVKKILDKDKRTTILKKRKNMPGNKWYRQFIKRNPRVKVVTSSRGTGTAEYDSAAAVNRPEYKALDSLLSGCESDEAGSESESDSEAASESASESESEVESLTQSPSPSDLAVSMTLGSEPGQDQDAEPGPKLETDPDASSLHDIEPSSSPDMAVGNTVTVTTSE